MSKTSATTKAEPIYRIAVPSPLRRTFDYLPAKSDPTPIELGSRVIVSFGRQQLIGIVVDVGAESTFEKSKLKRISNVLDTQSLLPASILKTLVWAADYYQHPIGDVFASALPNRLRDPKKQAAGKLHWERVKNKNLEEELQLLSRARRQQELLQYIADNESVSSEQITAAGFNGPLTKQLEEKSLIQSFRKKAATPSAFSTANTLSEKELTLNTAQQHAVQEIESTLSTFNCYLLDGITGSGKTEVYMHAIQSCLTQGKQCLILVPEIGLTPQTINRFKSRFAVPIAVLHSGLTDIERLSAWEKSRTGAAGIIIGTRSAVFTPMSKPGLIVIDEEHDSSFKQQEGFRYSARDFALVRAKEEKISVILGSATPSIESLSNCKSGKFTQLNLSERAGKSTPANLNLVDSSETHIDHGFTSTALDSIGMHLKQEGQVLVYLNRRGFAPVINCLSCGWIAECDSCNSHYTVHSKPAGILCHHCNKAKKIPSVCEQCQSRELGLVGIGTQQIERFLQQKFPATPVIRIDRDSTRRKNSLNEMLERIGKGEPCILIGTQMIAKGHHFPNISLVTILDADSGLFSADFRGLEQMGQSIVQVAGRAGRAERRGEVVIQSRHIAHESLQLLTTASYSEFADLVLSQRSEANLPPFSHLALFRIESSDYAQAIQFSSQLGSRALKLISQNKIEAQVIGPIPAPMEKRAGRFRIQVILKSGHRAQLNGLVRELCLQNDEQRKPAKLRWSIDIDPQDLI